MLVIGVDEAGRGPLVGSVVAAAVAFPSGFKIDGLTDSKKLSEKKNTKFELVDISKPVEKVLAMARKFL